MRVLQAYNWTLSGMKAYDRNHNGVAQFYRADDVDRLLRRALDSLIYHTEQTRPIDGTETTIRMLRDTLL